MSKVNVYIMGKRYEIPEGYTIMRAFEYAGYKLIRGCGCRAGVCGACATVYRIMGEYRLRSALACQTPVEEGMSLTQIPFFPAHKAVYDMNKVADPVEEFTRLYPELYRCLGCNVCSKICPQGLEVMDYIAAAYKRDLAKATELSIDCLMCGLCAARCPAEISQFNVAMYARRAYGRQLAEKHNYAKKRAGEIRQGIFNEEVRRLKAMDKDSLKELYDRRDIVSAKY